MFDVQDYELVDFGAGQKLERFQRVLVKRPSPPAVGRWECEGRGEPDWTFVLNSSGAEKGRWLEREAAAKEWRINYRGLSFELRPTPFGHLGVFPEQASNWAWLEGQSHENGNALNLFAYTGGTTLVLARLGYKVTHVDAARNVVQWARQNAVHSGLADAPIRWIAEDVLRYLRREVKRGNRYDVVVADPPSFGRGPKNEVWKIEQDFSEMLDLINELTNANPRLLLMSGHSASFGQQEMLDSLQQVFDHRRFRYDAGPMFLQTRSGRRLNAGYRIRAW